MYNNALLLASDERKSREGCHVAVTTKIGLKYTVCSAASFRFCILPYTTLLLGTVYLTPDSRQETHVKGSHGGNNRRNS